MAVSNDYPQFKQCTQAEVPPCVFNDIKRVANMDGVSFDNIFYSHNGSFAIKLDLKLELPMGYNETEGLVKSYEPVFVDFSSDYPDRVPKAYIARNDFDVVHTPHIYCEKDGLRPICLFFGNGDEWFANMEIEDFIKHLRTWYEDLASDSNIENGGEFEPMRWEGFRATVYYDYEHISREIDEVTDNLDHKEMFFVYLNHNKVMSLTKENNWILNSDIIKNKELLVGAVCWSPSTDPNDAYEVDLPKTYGGLKAYAKRYDVDIDTASSEIMNFYKGEGTRFIIIMAIRRSRKLIGVNSEYQLINFEVACEKNEEGKYVILDSSEVRFHAQESPFTRAKAHEMSKLKSEINPSLIIAGCGALGSKISMHFIRSGITDILFADPDKLSNFNLSRHALLANSVMFNKAEEMKNAANGIFLHETPNAKAFPFSIINILKDEKLIDSIAPNYMLDFTASKVVLNQLVKIEKRPPAISAAIYDNGNFGLLLSEDLDEDLKMDDILVSYFAQYKDDDTISNYLMLEKQNAQKPGSIINVGVGCNSETFILADDKISLYASAMSMTTKSIFEGKHKGGCWEYRVDNNCGLVVTKLTIPPFHVFWDESWQVRISDITFRNLLNQTADAAPNETGGYLIGQCNMKNKTIHVIDCIEAPQDTVRSEDNLILGTDGIKKKLSKIERRSGSTFGLIGQWHSHPNGPNDFSSTDIREFEEKISEMKANGGVKPVLELLITPNIIISTVLTLV